MIVVCSPSPIRDALRSVVKVTLKSATKGEGGQRSSKKASRNC